MIQFVALFWFLGRPRLYWVMPGETGVGFDDYKGNPEVLESARRIVELLRGVKEFQEMGGQPVRGLLLSGPPGTGKSYLAQCISTEAGVPFAYASAASFKAMFVGMDVLMIKRLYNKARRLAREYGGCVIFMDEIDAIGASRANSRTNMGIGGGAFGMFGGGTGGLNELLMQMDPPNVETGWFKKVLRVIGLYHSRVQTQPVLTIGATNIPETLDAALLRPGRFDRKIHVAPPTDRHRGEVIEYYLDKVKHQPNISISALVARFIDPNTGQGYTPVAIKHVINEAAIIAHFDGRDSVSYKDIVEAQNVHEFGLRQLGELTPVDRRRLAYHEAGHAIAQYYLMEREFPAYVTIHPRSDVEGAAGFMQPRPKETIRTKSKEDLLADIQVMLAARACESLFLDVEQMGAVADLAMATQAAAGYVGAYGMDGTLYSYVSMTGAGIAFERNNVPKERVEAVLNSQFKAVKNLLQEHREAVIGVAEALIERDELVAEEIEEIVKEADARRVNRLVLEDFKVLANGNGHRTNGHALVDDSTNGNSNGSPKIVDALPPTGGASNMTSLNSVELFNNDDPQFFMGG
jgi:ATP-dependent Zn protease